MDRYDFRTLFVGCVLFVMGMAAFFGRFSVAQFLGAKVILGEPEGNLAFWQVWVVGWVGVVLLVIGLAVMCVAVWRKPPLYLPVASCWRLGQGVKEGGTTSVPPPPQETHGV
jgi:hypothetical protein